MSEWSKALLKRRKGRTSLEHEAQGKPRRHGPGVHLPVWLSWEVLRLLRDMPTMACILAPMLERLFFSSVPTVPTAVSDWLPSVFSRLHMSPLRLVLLVMFIPPDKPICLFFILDAKSLSATTIDRGGHARTERGGQDRGERRPVDVRVEMIKGDRRGTGDDKVWGEKEKRTEFRNRSSWLTV